MPLLSVIVPVFNEAKTIREILEKINSVNVDKEIIVIDDGSSDDTGKILRGMGLANLKVIHHTTNRGKGAAFLTGLAHATGEFVIIQDADLEYEPNDYQKLLEAIKTGNADIVLGARFMKGYKGLFIHRIGNRFLTNLVNFFFGAKLNDCFTCYKLFRRETINRLGLSAKGFDIEIEIIAKALKNKLRIGEEFISYHPRSYAEGKKIRCRDGLKAAWSIIKYSLV
ncbi:MAG: glycosyltransferase family 2 protein [Candidatus Omnitrophica bacterium]|nr:glycosyltransferase family 2 protein [Candidatus Omnitrophota bacterium]